MIGAGYDPHGMVTLLETLKSEQGGGNSANFLSSHPATDERIANVRADIAANQPLPPVRSDDGGRLEIIQERIRLLVGTDPLEDLDEE